MCIKMLQTFPVCFIAVVLSFVANRLMNDLILQGFFSSSTQAAGTIWPMNSQIQRRDLASQEVVKWQASVAVQYVECICVGQASALTVTR